MCKAFLLYKTYIRHTRNYLKYISKCLSPLLVLFLQFSGIDQLFELFSFGVNPKERITVIYSLLKKKLAEKADIYILLGQFLGYSESLRASDRGVLQVFFPCFKMLNKTQAGPDWCRAEPPKHILLWHSGTQSKSPSPPAQQHSDMINNSTQDHVETLTDPPWNKWLSCSCFSNQGSFQTS